ncbi:MAG: 5'/3'-nucleotidase SurE [Myxococcota bacterium]
MNSPLILVTNDDGVHARGIKTLAKSLQPLGEVVVAAPDRNQSGTSHQITLHSPLRSHEIFPGWWSVQGTPADAVYLAIHELLPRRPDIVVSGINAGPNLSFDVHYSGTVGGAMEGTLMGIPGVAISAIAPQRGYEESGRFAQCIVSRVLQEGLPPDIVLNVNVPPGAAERFQMTFMGHRHFRHHVERRADPRGLPYYWIGGQPERARDLPGSDCNAVEAGFVSVTPITVDSTSRRALARDLEKWSLDGWTRVESTLPPEPVLPSFAGKA